MNERKIKEDAVKEFAEYLARYSNNYVFITIAQEYLTWQAECERLRAETEKLKAETEDLRREYKLAIAANKQLAKTDGKDNDN